MKGVVFDLCGNGGGLFIEVVNVFNVFIFCGEVVVIIKGKVKEWDCIFSIMGNFIDEEIFVVVLINDCFVFVLEIVSGVFQDYDWGVFMGQCSYGKGLV